MFGRIHQWTHLGALGFFWGEIINTWFNLFNHYTLFRLFILPCMIFSSLCVLKNLSISYQLSNPWSFIILLCVFLYNPFNVHRISSDAPLLFLILMIYVLSLSLYRFYFTFIYSFSHSLLLCRSEIVVYIIFLFL